MKKLKLPKSLLVTVAAPTLLALVASITLGLCVGDSIYFLSLTEIGASRAMLW